MTANFAANIPDAGLFDSQAEAVARRLDEEAGRQNKMWAGM
jgi:hypothetical protein